MTFKLPMAASRKRRLGLRPDCNGLVGTESQPAKQLRHKKCRVAQEFALIRLLAKDWRIKSFDVSGLDAFAVAAKSERYRVIGTNE